MENQFRVISGTAILSRHLLRAYWRLTMTILKLALLGSLRIAVLGSLKLALFVYTLFLSDTTFSGAVTEGNGQVGDASYGRGQTQWQ
jgi:hypothetical protein